MSRDIRPGGRRIGLLLLVPLAMPTPACAAEGLWDTMLETLNVKPAPAGPAPGFVERSRPDPDSTRYMPTALPHKVSPLAVKTPDEVQAAKEALDAAKAAQLRPPAPKTLSSAKVRKPAPAD